MAASTAVVDFVTDAVLSMREHWKLPTALRGGTVAMRRAGEMYLPREPGETVASWQNRRDRSFLFNAYGDTVDHVAGRPFSRQVRLGDGTPERMVEWAIDVDLEGSTLSDFALRAFDDAIDRGLTHALVDFPVTTGRLSLAEEREQGVRPFFVHVPADAILGWRMKRFGGRQVLTHLRFVESASVSDGEFGERLVQRIRVFDRALPGERRTESGRRLRSDQGATTYRIFEQDLSGQWALIDEGLVTVGEIPMRTLYTRRVSFMVGRPPLEDLAWKNLEHWQSASDQRHILHVARVPFLFGAGLGEDFANGKVEIGPNRILTASDASAKLGFVEHGGAAISAGRQDLLDILDQMVALGLAPLMERTGDPTATGRALDAAEMTSDLKTWVRSLERWLSSLFDLGARWVGDEEGALVDVHDDFTVALRGAEDVAELRAAREKRDLSRKQYLRELVRRGMLAESFDAHADAEERKSEAAEEPAPNPP